MGWGLVDRRLNEQLGDSGVQSNTGFNVRSVGEGGMVLKIGCGDKQLDLKGPDNCHHLSHWYLRACCCVFDLGWATKQKRFLPAQGSTL